MAKVCDHKSVGMFVWNDGKLLLIERGRSPYGFAVPAGHVDEDTSYEDAARRELKEEVGLDTVKLELIFEGRKENPCRREGGTWHQWKLFKVQASGDLHRSFDETKGARWYSPDEVKRLARRTEAYRTGDITEKDWEKDPGLEPVMYNFFADLGII